MTPASREAAGGRGAASGTPGLQPRPSPPARGRSQCLAVSCTLGVNIVLTSPGVRPSGGRGRTRLGSLRCCRPGTEKPVYRGTLRHDRPSRGRLRWRQSGGLREAVGHQESFVPTLVHQPYNRGSRVALQSVGSAHVTCTFIAHVGTRAMPDRTQRRTGFPSPWAIGDGANSTAESGRNGWERRFKGNQGLKSPNLDPPGGARHQDRFSGVQCRRPGRCLGG